jgi:hypothetical protein
VSFQIYIRKYDASVSCYTTALMLAKDLSFFITTLDLPSASLQSAKANSNTILIIAITIFGQGSCHLKMHRYSAAIDHLKIAIGYLTDNIFVPKKDKHQKNHFNGGSFMVPPELVPNKYEAPMRSNLGLNDAPEVEQGMEESHFSSLSIEVTYLLNALESLSDIYAVTCDWEKAICTATM